LPEDKSLDGLKTLINKIIVRYVALLIFAVVWAVYVFEHNLGMSQ